jgi:subtilisin family serine protease/RNA polymerase subunit RPABC4/transcription elongation factor Spt4
MNRKPLIYLLIAGVGLLLVTGVLVLILSPQNLTTSPSTPTPTRLPLPTLDVTPPPSLDELAEQYPELASIINDPELGSVYKEFLLAYEEGGQEAALEMARKRDLLTPDDNIQVTLVLDTDDHTALIEQLESVDVKIVSAYRDRVNVAVPMELIQTQLDAEEPGAIFQRLTELEHVIAVRLPENRAPDESDIEGEGVNIVKADDWHDAGFTGSRLRIGILDLGFAGYENLLGAELPNNVTLETFGWYDEEEVHGTACAEIIHEIAPDAELFFAWYDGTNATLGEAVDWMMEQEVNIISHSVGGMVGPRDGSGWDARLVNDVAKKGIVWVNSAGNHAESHYRGIFSDEDDDGYHEFVPNEEILALYRGQNEAIKVALNWEDDWEQATQDYDLFLYDSEGNPIAASQETQSGTPGQQPVEWITYKTNDEIIYAAIKAYDAKKKVVLDLFVNGKLEHSSPTYSICTPGDARESLTVGAVNWWSDNLAQYSSQGPTTDGRLKPEISAPTGVSNAMYNVSGFHGTSASAPHVAGAAALVWQAHPDFTRRGVVDYLLKHTVDLGAEDPDTAYGYGRLQLPAPPTVPSPTPTPAPTSTSTPSPDPTATALPPTTTPTASATAPPLPTQTPVTYVTPTPVPPSTGQPGKLGLTGLGILVSGLGCTGAGLLLIGSLGVLIFTRRSPKSSSPASDILPKPTPASKECPVCGTNVRSKARFCPVCGSRVSARHCKYCGAQLRPEAKFCPECGQPDS